MSAKTMDLIRDLIVLRNEVFLNDYVHVIDALSAADRDDLARLAAIFGSVGVLRVFKNGGIDGAGIKTDWHKMFFHASKVRAPYDVLDEIMRGQGSRARFLRYAMTLHSALRVYQNAMLPINEQQLLQEAPERVQSRLLWCACTMQHMAQLIDLRKSEKWERVSLAERIEIAELYLYMNIRVRTSRVSSKDVREKFLGTVDAPADLPSDKEFHEVFVLFEDFLRNNRAFSELLISSVLALSESDQQLLPDYSKWCLRVHFKVLQWKEFSNSQGIPALTEKRQFGVGVVGHVKRSRRH